MKNHQMTMFPEYVEHVRDTIKHHNLNPHVYEKFEEITIRAMSRSKGHWGQSAILNIMRWETAIGSSTDPDYKINNDHGPFYARLFEAKHPKFKGFFRSRSSVFDTVDFSQFTEGGGHE